MKQTHHNVHAVYDGLFNTASGGTISLIEPLLETITIGDIACGLSKVCRFGGQITDFYSVAQHSVLVCMLAPDDLKFEALMHDAAEAYLGDVIKPLKVMLGSSYTDIESRYMAVISKKYKLCPDKLASIKLFDKIALDMEHDYLQKGNSANWVKFWKQITPANYTWMPKKAEEIFNAQYLKYRY